MCRHARFTVIFPSLVLFAAPPAHAATTFTQHSVGTLGGAVDVSVADVDRDGDLDVVGVGYTADRITWWENAGGSFTAHVVATGFNGGRSVRACDRHGRPVDLNRDGRTDIVGAAFYAEDIAWWRNDGDGTFTRLNLDTGFHWADVVEVTDFDGDGDQDVIGVGAQIAWFENSGYGVFTKHPIAPDDGFLFLFAHASDVNEDGHEDLLVTSTEVGQGLTWFENGGDGTFTRRAVGGVDHAHTAHFRDIDGDGDLDIAACSDVTGECDWWENDGAEVFSRHPVDGSFAGAVWFDACDLDFDGDTDFFGTAYGADEFAWWESDGLGGFTRHSLGSAADAFCLVPADLDNDGMTDLVGATRGLSQIRWYENDLAVPGVRPGGTATGGALGLGCSPNPSRGRTAIRCELPARGRASLRVVDAGGRSLAILRDGEWAEGPSIHRWDAESLPAGVYFLELTAGSRRASCKVVLVR